MKPQLLLLFLCLLGAAAAPATQPAGYFNDFEKTPLGKLPDDLMILGGEFTVKEEAGNRFLEVSPDPIDAFGLLFGPNAVELPDVRARIFATSTGQRFPEFGIGGGDAGGYKLFLLPGQGILELRRGDDSVARLPSSGWRSGQWTCFRLRITQPKPGNWLVEGKAWPASAQEPQTWQISSETTEQPPAGRASVWASTYSGTPIRFDDLKVDAMEK